MKTIIETSAAPSPVGPYNQAIFAGNTLYISGQIAIHQPTGEIINATIEEETKQVMENLGHILKEAGLGYENIVKCSVFVSDMHQYAAINSVYSTYFNDDTAPARELVEVANLPKFVNVEISAIAVK
jgi:2-iminobutanoate/2-iminopropanoate deaminase